MKSELRVGERHGKLTITKVYRIEGITYCDCVCDCGNNKNKIIIHSVLSGGTSSCGNHRPERKKTSINGISIADIRKTKIGDTLSSLIHKSNNDETISVYDEWLTRCNGIYNFYIWSMENGYSNEKTLVLKIDNGVYSPDNCVWINKHIKHKKLYSCWSGIKSRCDNPNNQSYKDYGGRGVTYCNEWKDFYNFYKWSIANMYVDGLTIDRIDVNGNYEPSNCRWATKSMQSFNKRNNSKIYPGISKIRNTNKYQVDIKNIHLCRCDTLEEALKIRKKAELEYFGEYLEK